MTAIMATLAINGKVPAASDHETVIVPKGVKTARFVIAAWIAIIGVLIAVVASWSHEHNRRIYSEAAFEKAEVNREKAEVSRLQAEAAKLHAEAKMVRVLDSAPGALISCDEDRKIVFFNQAAQKLFGYTETEIVGKSLDILLPPEIRNAHVCVMSKAADNLRDSREPWHQTRGRFPTEAVRKDGSLIPIDLTVRAISLGDGRVEFIAFAMARKAPPVTSGPITIKK